MRSKRTTISRKVKSQKALERKREELLGILMMILGFFVLIALFTYDPNETPQNIDINRIHNGLGFAGVYIAHYLIRWTIGYPVFILPFLIIAWGWVKLFGISAGQLAKITWLSILFATLISIIFALHEIISAPAVAPAFRDSGRLGGLGAQLLILMFGHYGSVVVLIGLILIGVLFATTLSFSEMYEEVASLLTRSFMNTRHIIEHYFSRFMRRRRRPIVTHALPEEGAEMVAETTEPRPTVRPIPIPTPDESRHRQLRLDLEAPEERPQSREEIVIPENGDYQLPPLDLLQEPEATIIMGDEQLQQNANLLEEKLADFGISTKVVEIHPGPVITRYELQLAPGIKVSRITSLADDLAMAMRAQRIRIVAPIPGKSAIGIEIPNPNPSIVYLKEILASEEFRHSPSPLTVALGKTISGQPYVFDLSAMPHLLVAGSTGSGKSVCLNTIIASILYKARPDEVQFVLIDPKRLELSNYARLYRHHLNYVEGQKEKVATNPKSASAILKSLEQEMENRYERLASAGVRNIQEYNQRVREGKIESLLEDPVKPLVYIVLIVDELADLMLTSNATKEVEEPIARLTQMSRAVGIHLVLATQRPSVDVITGVIKANFPARIAFQVASKIDSRTILDMNGAEKLLGRGDMLFLPPASPEPIRVHNAYISLEEIENIIDYVRRQPLCEKKPLPAYAEEEEGGMYGYERGKRDPLFNEALNLVVRHQQGSVSLIQRRLKVGYSRAARLIDELEDAGVVGPFEGSKAREVYLKPEDLEGMPLDDEDEEQEL